MSRKINYNDTVMAKVGGYNGKQGKVTMVADINGTKRYYVEFADKQVKWYTYFQLLKIKND